MSEKRLKAKDVEKSGAPVRGGTSHKVYQITNNLDEYNAERCISRDLRSRGIASISTV